MPIEFYNPRQHYIMRSIRLFVSEIQPWQSGMMMIRDNNTNKEKRPRIPLSYSLLSSVIIYLCQYDLLNFLIVIVVKITLS